jgi:hypothetical protein
VRAAKEATANLHAVANHSALAMLTTGRGRLNGTLEAVECVPRPGCYQFESFVVLVATNLAFSHRTPHLFQYTDASASHPSELNTIKLAQKHLSRRHAIEAVPFGPEARNAALAVNERMRPTARISTIFRF